jgi:hypothetical protein
VIISNRHRYLFVELPRTGSTAVHHELCSMYGGEPILTKHATYEDFLKVATPEQKRYFVFSTVRNPLDDAVSKYFKVKAGRAAGARVRRGPARGRGRDRLLNRLVDTYMTRFVRRTDADFAAFFLRYYVLPYDTWASLSHKRFGFVMRFENLAEDFEHVLRSIGLEPERPLPVANPTGARQRDFEAYYVPRIRKRARRVLGPYMARWGYRFPPSWGPSAPSTTDWLAYRSYSFVACVYWRHLRRAR